MFCYFYVLSYPKKTVYQFVTNSTAIFRHLNIHFNIRTLIVLLVIKDININMLGCQIMHSFASFFFKTLIWKLLYFLLLIFFYSAALEVELSDDSFPPEDFGIVSGMLNVKWDRIAPYPFKKKCLSDMFSCSFKIRFIVCMDNMFSYITVFLQQKQGSQIHILLPKWFLNVHQWKCYPFHVVTFNLELSEPAMSHTQWSYALWRLVTSTSPLPPLVTWPRREDKLWYTV